MVKLKISFSDCEVASHAVESDGHSLNSSQVKSSENLEASSVETQTIDELYQFKDIEIQSGISTKVITDQVCILFYFIDNIHN